MLLTVLVFAARRIGHGSAAEGDDTPGFTLPSRGVLVLAVLCFLVMITEGAMADWSGLYVRQDLGASAAVAALAYSFFTAGMTVGRLVGDAINARIGPVALLRGGALLTGIPLAALLLVGQPAAALFGLFLVGLGVANGVPLMFCAAGRQPDTPPGPGIAAVSSMGSLGFLAGPPVFGFIADADLAAVVALAADPRRRRRLPPRLPRRRRARARRRRPTPTPPGAMTQFAAVLSDLDGVLVDSMAATSRAWAAWGARHGLDGVAIQAANHGKPAGEVVAQFVPPSGSPPRRRCSSASRWRTPRASSRCRARRACSRSPSSPSPRRASRRWPARGSAPRAWRPRTCS